MTEQFAEVIAGCRVGDPQALRVFVVEFYGGMMRIARSRIGDEDRARDAVQSFFLMLLERQILSQFRGDRMAQLRKFLTVCIKRHIDSEMRHRAGEIGLEPEAVESTYPSSEEEFERKSIREIMLQIDWRYRQVLDLELESYKQREIAEMLCMPMGTVASYSHRAKEILARLLRENGFLILPLFLTIALGAQLAA